MKMTEVQSPRRTSDPEAVRLIDEELEDLQCREAEAPSRREKISDGK